MARHGFESVNGSTQLYRLEDCCAVYLLKHGRRGVLIDLGSGVALDHLAAVGVEGVDAVFFTHAHRDQCQGAARAVAAGIPLRFPVAAREIVEGASRSDFQPPSPLVGRYVGRFEPPLPIGEAVFDVRPDTRVAWAGGELEVVGSAGHSPDQVAYLADLGDFRVCVSGDALHSPGKVHEPYHLETDHYTGAGCRQAVESLRRLRAARPDLLCPSHGPVTAGDCWRALDDTIHALLHLADLKDTICPRRPAVPRLAPPHANRLLRLSEHLLIWNNSYFLLSQEGPVLMVDCGEALSEAFHEQWRAMAGERPVEVVLISHIHCDHVDGIASLRERGGMLGGVGGGGAAPEVWALQGLAPLLARPHASRRPFLPARPVELDRELPNLTEFEWREYQFHAYDFPGQTDYHALYATAVAGRRIVFSGDNFYPPQQWGGTGGLSGLNGGHPIKGWRSSIELMLMLEPEWVLAAHVQPFPYRRSDFVAMLEWTEEVSTAMRAIAPDGCLERHHDPHLIELFPYCQSLEGDTVTVTARVRNPYEHPVQVDLALVLPPGLTVKRDHRRITAPEGAVGEASWTLRAERESLGETSMLVVDVVYEGSYLGQKAEAYVYRGSGSP